MFARGFDEETPELSTFSIKHTELERDTQKRLHRFESVILVCFRYVLRCALQRVERATVILARFVNRAHDSLITADECFDVHFGNEVERSDGVVSGSIGAEQSSFALATFPELRVRKCVQHSDHRHRNRTLTNELDLPFEDVFGIVVEADDEPGHYLHATTLNL